MFVLSGCVAADFWALYPSSCLCVRGVQLVDLVTTKCLFSRMNIMRLTLLASTLLRRSPMRWASAEKLRSARQLFWMWVFMPDVPIPLLLPSDGVHFMKEVVRGSPINFLGQARNTFVLHGRGESTHKPQTSNSQLPLAVMRLLLPPIVVSALRGGCNTTGSLPYIGSSDPGADEAADPASILLVVADPATPLLVALGFPSKPLIVLLDHAERRVGRCGGRFMGRCRGVSLSSRPQRGSSQK